MADLEQDQGQLSHQVAEMKDQLMSDTHLHGFGSAVFANVGGGFGAALGGFGSGPKAEPDEGGIEIESMLQDHGYVPKRKGKAAAVKPMAPMLGASAPAPPARLRSRRRRRG